MSTARAAGPAPRYDCTLTELPLLRPSEEVRQSDVERLARDIERSGHWTTMLPVERGTMIIMDGNHRWHAARMLGLVRVPCAMLGYDDARVRVTSWREGTHVSVAEIHAALARGRRLPYKTTRHHFEPRLPAVAFPLARLRQAAVTTSLWGVED